MIFGFSFFWLMNVMVFRTNLILYFDGVCNLCNGFVNFVIKRDVHRRFQFASLHGHTAKVRLPENLLSHLNSVVLEKNAQFYVKSTAVIHVLRNLGGLWRLLSLIACILPLKLQDGIYDLVAKNRYRLCGKRESCRMPAPEEKDLFLK